MTASQNTSVIRRTSGAVAKTDLIRFFSMSRPCNRQATEIIAARGGRGVEKSNCPSSAAAPDCKKCIPKKCWQEGTIATVFILAVPPKMIEEFGKLPIVRRMTTPSSPRTLLTNPRWRGNNNRGNVMDARRADPVEVGQHVLHSNRSP